MSRTRWRLKLLVCVSVPFLLACSGFMADFNEGMTEEAQATIDEAREKVKQCKGGKNKRAMGNALNEIQTRFDSGKADVLATTFNAGLVIGVAEEGCTDEAMEGMHALVPELLPAR